MSHGFVHSVPLFGKSGYKDVVLTVINYANLTGESFSLVGPRGTITITEGVDYSAATSDLVTAQNIATALAALDEITAAQAFASGSDAKVFVHPVEWYELTSVSTDSSASDFTIVATATDNYVSVAPSGTRLSGPIRIEGAEYFSVSVEATVDGAGTPNFDLEYRMTVSDNGVDGSNGTVQNPVWSGFSSPFPAIVSGQTGSDGQTFTYGDEFNPPVGAWIQFRYTHNDATNAITATDSSGLRGWLNYWS